MTDFKRQFQTNKETWNKKVAIHAKSDMYDLESFKKGKSSLNRYELDDLGEVDGKSILHLQCHFGQDTLSLSRMGAQCTGIDFSEEAVRLAKKLNQELNLTAKFISCNVLDTSEFVHETFDVVFTSYGVIGWLPNLEPWAKMIAERLKPGGFFYMIEFHPIVWMFDYLSEPPQIKYGYNQKEAIYEEYKGTYADMKSSIVSKEYGWNHGLSEVVNSLTENGLHIDFLKEYDESPYNVLPGLELSPSGQYRMKEPLFPLLFAIKATKH
ncbi:MAG: class I SAM-dependent methyltransferase [Flavobacteriaceae bacterium]|nr:class I SAM-dependent methyltransferase [Bacteroidia bacterium]MBT8289125.1 class I SAM-dependent methyltransferase [Bacteroidia bacterium]NNF73603.1 class I SAM-dependent methyltransferase [Flavobacteriaceae bacterium]NNK73353.1 class I SAM-dependent methyltransferase [Flavobacteriaceae bacterium]